MYLWSGSVSMCFHTHHSTPGTSGITQHKQLPPELSKSTRSLQQVIRQKPNCKKGVRPHSKAKNHAVQQHIKIKQFELQFYLYFLCCASTSQHSVLFPLGWYKTHLCYRWSSIPSVIYISSFILTEIRTLNWQQWVSAQLELNTLGKENIFGYKSNSLKQRRSSISLTFASD